MSSPLPDSAPEATLVEYAGFWKRFWASVIDAVVVWVATVILMLIMLLVTGGFAPVEHGERPFAAGIFVMMYFLLLLAGVLYGPLMESSERQGTLGKLALGLCVTDEIGNRITFGRAVGRNLSKFLSGIVLGIGYIMAGFTPKKQAMHDMIAGTLVLARQSVVPQQVARNVSTGS